MYDIFQIFNKYIFYKKNYILDKDNKNFKNFYFINNFFKGIILKFIFMVI